MEMHIGHSKAIMLDYGSPAFHRQELIELLILDVYFYVIFPGKVWMEMEGGYYI